MQLEIFWNYKGQEVSAKVEICPGDPDVGIMGPYPEFVALFDSDGGRIPLTEEEERVLLDNEEFCCKIHDKYYGDWNDPRSA